MAGDVGRAVKDTPGYGGYVPGCFMSLPNIKAGPNTRLDIGDRHTVSHPPKNDAGTGPVPTIYQTDMVANWLSGEQSPGEIARVTRSAQFIRDPPAPRNFVAISQQQVASLDVTGGPEDRSFFSRMLKERQQQLAERPDEFSRRSESMDNSKKGHSGASNLHCFHQPPAVAADGPQVPMRQTSSTPFLASDKRGACHPDRVLHNANGGLKLSRMNTDTTYALDYGKKGSNPRDRLAETPQDFAETSSTIDLAGGTTKFAAKKRIPGYMGHVPSAKSNVDKMNGDDDALMQFHKSHLLLTSSNNLPGYSGHQPRSGFNDSGKPMAPTLELTTSGSVSKYVAEDTIEKSMKDVHYGRPNALRSFFTRGEGDDVGQVADSYFQSYRPNEGLLKV